MVIRQRIVGLGWEVEVRVWSTNNNPNPKQKMNDIAQADITYLE